MCVCLHTHAGIYKRVCVFWEDAEDINIFNAFRLCMPSADWHSPHHLFVLIQPFLLFTITGLPFKVI